MLGHSNIQLSQDIYQSVLDDLAIAAAETTARLIPRHL